MLVLGIIFFCWLAMQLISGGTMAALGCSGRIVLVPWAYFLLAWHQFGAPGVVVADIKCRTFAGRLRTAGFGIFWAVLVDKRWPRFATAPGEESYEKHCLFFCLDLH